MLILLANNPNFIWLISFSTDIIFVDRDKNLFSKEENETVIGEYLNTKFADDLRGKSSPGNHGINLYGFMPDRSGVASSVSFF